MVFELFILSLHLEYTGQGVFGESPISLISKSKPAAVD